jgi:hypothetical protein
MLVKIHKTYRKTIAVCDEEVFGKELEEGKKYLDLRGEFFNGEKKDKEELEEIVRIGVAEDVTFYIVGKESIESFKSFGLINESGISYIKEVPIALILL